MHLLAIDAPSSKGYDLLLLVHVAVALVTMVAVISSSVAATSLRRAAPSGPWPPGGARYFAPGRELAGRTLYLIPVTGASLIGISQGAASFGDGFVGIGIVLWLAIALIAERFVFAPAARLRRTIASSSVVPVEVGWRHDAATLTWGVDTIVALLLVAAVVMVAQP